MSAPGQGAPLCECGCGEPTSRATKTNARTGVKAGDYNRFRRGHRSCGTAWDHDLLLSEWEFMRDSCRSVDFGPRVGIKSDTWHQIRSRAEAAGDPRARLGSADLRQQGHIAPRARLRPSGRTRSAA